jgi:hypothetical protein
VEGIMLFYNSLKEFLKLPTKLLRLEDNKNTTDINRRIISDLVILSECFSQHVAFYDQKYSFFLYGQL